MLAESPHAHRLTRPRHAPRRRRHPGRDGQGRRSRAQRNREQYADALRPLLGMDAAEYERQARRAKLLPAAKTECGRLDVDLARAEAHERTDAKASLPTTQRTLFELRSRFKELRC